MAHYIHYGSAKFDPHRFVRITNQRGFNKPLGGLWASLVGAKFGWRNWCEHEEFGLGSLNTHFRFTIAPEAKIFHLYSSKDLDRMPRCEDCFGLGSLYPDFEKMVEDGWDAIELHLSSTDKNWDNDGLYWQLYGWDCDSILIMNPEIILPTPQI